jgi:hypothetical protein
MELNGDFAAQGLAALRDLRLADGDSRLNPNGGAIALGPAPFQQPGSHRPSENGMEFARIMTTVLVGAGLIFAAGAAHAQRRVFVNGQFRKPQQLVVLDPGFSAPSFRAAATGSTPPPAPGATPAIRAGGRVVGDLCLTRGQRQRSLSERGLLYTAAGLHSRWMSRGQQPASSNLDLVPAAVCLLR